MLMIEKIVGDMCSDISYAADVLMGNTEIKIDDKVKMEEYLLSHYQPVNPGWTTDDLVLVNDSSITDEVQLVYFNRFNPDNPEFPYIGYFGGKTSATSNDECLAWHNAWKYDEYKDKLSHVEDNRYLICIGGVNVEEDFSEVF